RSSSANAAANPLLTRSALRPSSPEPGGPSATAAPPARIPPSPKPCGRSAPSSTAATSAPKRKPGSTRSKATTPKSPGKRSSIDSRTTDRQPAADGLPSQGPAYFDNV